MKKRILSILVACMICISMLPTAAFAAGNLDVKVTASATNPSAGDTVTFTVSIGAVTKLQSMEFKIDVPAGMTYVANSGRLQDGLKDTLHVASADWTESSQKFTMYGDSEYTSTVDTTIMTFSCSVDASASGSLSVSVKAFSAADSDYETINANIIPATVTVAGAPATEYDISVTNGKATVSGTEVTEAAEGETVTLTADTPASGQEFDKWTVTSGTIMLADENAATTTFTMPASAVSVAATYKSATHSHTYNQEVVKSEALKTAADCTHDAVYYKSCSCGAVSTNDADTFTATGSALGHDYTERVLDDAHKKSTASNCQEHDTYWYDCSRCDKNAKDDLAATDKWFESDHAGNHVYDTGAWGYKGLDGHAHKCQYDDAHDTPAAHIPGAAATETTPQTCTECGYVITPALGHTHSYGTAWKSDANKHWHECACGDKADEAAHTFAWIVDTAATATAPGSKHEQCETCGYAKAAVAIPATGYTIAFNANGGTASADSMQTGADGKLASLPTASRSRYTFDGWFTAETGGEQVTTATVFSGNATVYAHWTYSGGSSSGNGSSVTTYSVTVGKTANGTVSVNLKTAAKGSTVTITVTPDKGYVLETLTALDKDGKELKLTEKNGKYTFTMPASKVEVKATFMDDNTMLNYFVDVKAGDFFYDAVLWAAQKGITTGVNAVEFGPSLSCTRAQIVTFLWRAAGSPEPKSAGSFADVPADSYYAKAVAWAVENGITSGTGDGKFSPDAACTREQAVTFLYRAAGSPAVSGGSAFSDVAENVYYAKAVAWAEKNGVTGGIGGGLFGSGNDCTRGQIVTFLYRAYQGK